MGEPLAEPGAPGPGELPARPLGQQPTGPGAVVLEQGQAIPAAWQARPAQKRAQGPAEAFPPLTAVASRPRLAHGCRQG